MRYLVLFILSLIVFESHSQEIEGFRDDIRGSGSIRVAFWNLENLFFPIDDSLTNDDSFTPYGDNHWTFTKYNDKLQKLGKAITSIGGWEAVEIIGFCEVEDRIVLQDLINKTGLKTGNYEIVHQNSPDRRGIDVALIYRKDKIKVYNQRYIKVDFGPGSRPTRDVLQISATLENNDTIHVLYNHWPSKYGGALATVPKRARAAQVVKEACDSIFVLSPNANIILMGDFNDTPIDASVKDVLHALPDTNNTNTNSLINLTWPLVGNDGTHKYQGEWSVIDQVIVSKNLYSNSSKTQLYDYNAHIFKAPFLLESDDSHMGTKPFRTYIGMKHHGGYSDHLPIYLDLRLHTKVDNP